MAEWIRDQLRNFGVRVELIAPILALLFGLGHPTTQAALHEAGVDVTAQGIEVARGVRRRPAGLFPMFFGLFVIWVLAIGWPIFWTRTLHGHWELRFMFGLIPAVIFQLSVIRVTLAHWRDFLLAAAAIGGFMNLERFRLGSRLVAEFRGDAGRLTDPEHIATRWEAGHQAANDALEQEGIAFEGTVNIVRWILESILRIMTTFGGYFYTVYAFVLMALPFWKAPWLMWCCLFLTLAMVQALLGLSKHRDRQGNIVPRPYHATFTIRFSLFVILVASTIGLWSGELITELLKLNFLPGLHPEDPERAAMLRQGIKVWLAVGILPWILVEMLLARTTRPGEPASTGKSPAGKIRWIFIGLVVLIPLWYGWGYPFLRMVGHWFAANPYVKTFSMAAIVLPALLLFASLKRDREGHPQYALIVCSVIFVPLTAYIVARTLDAMYEHMEPPMQKMYGPGGVRGTSVPAEGARIPANWQDPAHEGYDDESVAEEETPVAEEPIELVRTGPPIRQTPHDPGARQYWMERGFRPSPYDICLATVMYSRSAETEVKFGGDWLYLETGDTLYVTVPPRHDPAVGGSHQSINFDCEGDLDGRWIGDHSVVNDSTAEHGVLAMPSAFRNPEDFPMTNKPAWLPLYQVGRFRDALVPNGEIGWVTRVEGKVKLRLNHPSGNKFSGILLEKKFTVDESSYTQKACGEFTYFLLVRRHGQDQGRS